MDVTPRIASDRMVIQSYKNSGFKISGAEYASNQIVMGDRVLPWNEKSFDTLDVSDFDVLAEAFIGSGCEVLLIGSGEEFAFLSPDITSYLQKKGIYPEVMNTGAACRTFNVLMSEGREVCAALIAI